MLLLAATSVLNAQTVISNEKLVSTTFVVVEKHKVAFCSQGGCTAKVAMFDPVMITCPGTSEQTCTIHIVLDGKVTIGLGDSFYQFLIDDAAPTIGPTGKNGAYTIVSENRVVSPDSRFSMPASVVGTVVNSESNTHSIAVSVGCHRDSYPCQIDSNATTMRVDIFQP